MTTYFDPRKESEKHLPESERRGIYPSPHPDVWEQQEHEQVSYIDDLVMMITAAVGTAIVLIAVVIIAVAVFA